MRILIATDAWKPQVNGVVRTLENTRSSLESLGHEIKVVSPDNFWSIPCPTYPEIQLAWGVAPVGKMIRDFAPHAIHIATEGPVGFAVRTWCVVHEFPFTTCFTTRFPEYISVRLPISSEFSYGYFRWFHCGASCTMVATPSIEEELKVQGFRNLARWSRGVDVDLFNPWKPYYELGESPVCLYVGRVAVEKNLRAFLELDIPGTKVVVGDGPDLKTLKEDYPGVSFRGSLFGEDLALMYANADVFVFPSRTDTFGIVMLEAMASGLPVAAYKVPGPEDVVMDGVTGCLREDLKDAVYGAIGLKREDCRAAAIQRSWNAATEQFLSNLHFHAFPFSRVEPKAV